MRHHLEHCAVNDRNPEGIVKPCDCDPYNIISEIEAEIARATAKYPEWPTDPIHAFAVVGEEFGETQKAVFQMVYEPHKSSLEALRKEAIQLAAMSLRFLVSFDCYEFSPGPQHLQSPIP